MIELLNGAWWTRLLLGESMVELLNGSQAAQLASKILGRTVAPSWVAARVPAVKIGDARARYRPAAVEDTARTLLASVTTTEAAQLLGVSYHSLRKWMAQGHFQAYRVKLDGRTYGFRRDDIPKMLKELEG